MAHLLQTPDMATAVMVTVTAMDTVTDTVAMATEAVIMKISLSGGLVV